MTRSSLIRVLLAILLIAPAIAQDEERPYFSLSTSRTFGTHDHPAISLSAYNIDAVQLRVYRIKNPVEFYRKLEDPHSFGTALPRPRGKKTLIEIIHSWKRGLRANIRRSLRAQFTESPRAHWQRTKTPTKPVPSTPQQQATYYAQTPLLNSDQLVLTQIQPITSKTRWASQQVALNVKGKGVFLVEAVHGDLRAYTILNISDTVLVTKVGRERVLGFVADRYSGDALSNASIFSMARNGTPAEAKTNSDGIVNITNIPATAESARIVAIRGEDAAFGEIPNYTYAARTANWTGYIYTDRPVYRPGDTMHFRGIFRIAQTVGYTVPASQTVAVQITDSDGKSVFSKELKTNAGGIVHDEYSLPRNSALGNYFIQVKGGEGQMNGNFEVQEYKKPEYEVRVTPAQLRVLEGNGVDIAIDARYYFGEPVNGATVKYAVYRSRYWSPLWGDPDEEQSQEEMANPSYEGENEQILDKSGKLDSDGKLNIHLDTSVSSHKIDYRYRIEARVTDQANREISGTGYVTATYGSFLVYGEPSRYFFQPSTSGSLSVNARDYDGNPVRTAVHVEIAEWQWKKNSASKVLSTAEATTDVEGAATANLKIPSVGGSYRLRISARTPENRLVESSTFIWVSGPEETGLFSSGPRSLQIVADKKSYKPGDVAHLLVVAGQSSAPVLVTVEGRDIRSVNLLHPKGGTATFDYPVRSENEPAFFISAQFIRNGELFTGTKRIKVPPDDHKLTLKISTDKPQYLPGQTANYAIEATTAEGKAVPNTDLSLGVVDEAIYAIRPDRTPDILKFFYGQEWNNVYTESSLQFYFNGEAGTRRMQLAALRPPTALAQLKPERLVQPKVRKAFPDTAFWAADLTTDGAGRAQTRVTFPDSLTTWRATARGATTEQRFGAGQLKTVVRKNVILRLAVPRFFVQGDEVVVSAIVHNYLPSAKQARVSLAMVGLNLLGGEALQEVDIPSRGEAKVSWRVKAQVAKTATLTGQALTDEESDALELSLPVHPPGVPRPQSSSGSILNTNAARFSFTFPADAQPASRSISFRLSSSIAGSVFSALDYLTSFPYGCVEQTMSSFLPNLMVSKAVADLGIKQQSIDPESLHQKVTAGLNHLYEFQHEDGGWGWWVSDASHPFMTAYVVSGLAEARRDGITVNGAALQRAASWLVTYLAKNTGDNADLRAYASYALNSAGRVDKAAIESAYGQRSQMTAFGLAVLGLAFEFEKDPRAAELATQLEKSVQQNDAEAWWPSTRDTMLDFEADSTPETTAYAVKLLSHQRPQSPLLPRSALWLVNHRNEGYWWSSTKQTAMVIYGLLDYLKASNELHPNLSVNVRVNGNLVGTQTFNDQSPVSAPELTLDASKIQSGTNQIEIESNGQGRLYYSAIGLHYSTDARFEKQGAISLNVLRDYFRLIPGKDGDRIVYDLQPLSGPVSSGDTLAVRLTVTGSQWKYLLAEDPIPAGAEFIEKDNLYTLRTRPPWWQYFFTRREMHDDRMAIFETVFPEGQQQFFYLLKVVNPGLFEISPARVGPMYQSSVQATTEQKTLEVK